VSPQTAAANPVSNEVAGTSQGRASGVLEAADAHLLDRDMSEVRRSLETIVTPLMVEQRQGREVAANNPEPSIVDGKSVVAASAAVIRTNATDSVKSGVKNRRANQTLTL
jgi:hypothetical protein